MWCVGIWVRPGILGLVLGCSPWNTGDNGVNSREKSGSAEVEVVGEGDIFDPDSTGLVEAPENLVSPGKASQEAGANGVTV